MEVAIAHSGRTVAASKFAVSFRLSNIRYRWTNPSPHGKLYMSLSATAQDAQPGP